MRQRNGVGRMVVHSAAALLLGLGAMVGSTASSWAEPPPVGKKKIVYALPGGSSALIMLKTASKMLNKIGYEVDERTMGTGLIYQGLATGDVDLMSSGFLPGQHPHVNKHEDKLDILGTSYAPVPSGLMAPPTSRSTPSRTSRSPMSRKRSRALSTVAERVGA